MIERIIEKTIERKRKALFSEFDKKIRSDSFQAIFKETLAKYGVESTPKTSVLIDNEKSKPYLSVDISPEGLFDTEILKKIIREIKPKNIFYVRGREDDFGYTARLTIPTENQEIKLEAHVYVIDQAGGIWSEFNNPLSDGYKDVHNHSPIFNNGRFELQKKC